MIVKPKLFSAICKIIFGVGFVLFGLVSNAQTIASWNYETLPAYPAVSSNPAADIGTGTSSVVNPIPAETISPSARTGMNPAGTGCGTQDGVTAWALEPFHPGSSNQSNGVQYNVSTAGKSNITFTWDMRFSNTAPNTCRLQYTTNGSTWTDFIMTSGNTTICASGASITSNGCLRTSAGDVFRRTTVNLSSITLVNNNANFGVRLLAAFDPTATPTPEFRQATTPTAVATTTGTWRFDNVTVASLGTIPTNVIFNPAGAVSICSGSSTNLRFSITPTPAAGETFTLVYKDNFGNNFTVNNYVNLAIVAVAPTVNTTYNLVSITNPYGVAGVVSTTSNRVVTVNPLPTPSTLSASFVVTDFQSCSTAPSTTPYANFPPAGTATYSGTSYTVTYSPALPYASSTSFTVTIRNNTTLCLWTSSTYTFTRYTAPAIVTPPSATPQSTCAGTAFSALTVSATGTGLSYQWYSDDGLGTGSSINLIPGAISASYTPQSTVVGALKYYVRVSGYCPSALNSSYSGYYTVNAAAVAGSVASAQTICIGSTPADLILSGQTGSVVKWQRANDAGFTAGVSDISNTTTTLTGAAIGALNQTTYFRAFIQNGTCNVTTAPVQIFVKSTTYISGNWTSGPPDNTTSAIFDDDFLSTGNLNACSVLVNSGNVVIDTGHVLTVQNGLNVSGGTLTFIDNSSLIQINNAVNSGNITYKRQTLTPIGRYDYTYWSSPVFGQTLSGFSPTTLPDKYFWFNPVSYTWNTVAVPGITSMTAGQGYIIRGPQGNATPALWQGSFFGTPNNGDITPLISGSNSVVFTSSSQNMNCLGNPYPSALSADLFMAGNSATLGTGTTLYFWTHNTPISGNLYNSNDYAVYNYTGGVGTIPAPAPGANTNTPNGKIAAGQGFMIKAIATGTVTFTNAMRLAGSGNNGQFFRQGQTGTSGIEKSRIWLELKNDSGAYKQTLVGYIENATNAIDEGFDGEIVEAGNPVSFYSLIEDKKLSIQGRSMPFQISDTVPMGIKISAAGNYNIGLSDFDGVFDDPAIGIFLDDRLLNISSNLREGNYSFGSDAGVFDGRFVLHYTNNLLATSEIAQQDNAIVIYDQNRDIIVNSGNKKMKDIRVYDGVGRQIHVFNEINKSEYRFDTGLKSQVILIEITLQDGNVITKKYVR